jgi:hypothetical protein
MHGGVFGQMFHVNEPLELHDSQGVMMPSCSPLGSTSRYETEYIKSGFLQQFCKSSCRHPMERIAMTSGFLAIPPARTVDYLALFFRESFICFIIQYFGPARGFFPILPDGDKLKMKCPI